MGFLAGHLRHVGDAEFAEQAVAIHLRQHLAQQPLAGVHAKLAALDMVVVDLFLVIDCVGVVAAIVCDLDQFVSPAQSLGLARLRVSLRKSVTIFCNPSMDSGF